MLLPPQACPATRRWELPCVPPWRSMGPAPGGPGTSPATLCCTRLWRPSLRPSTRRTRRCSSLPATWPTTPRCTLWPRHCQVMIVRRRWTWNWTCRPRVLFPCFFGQTTFLWYKKNNNWKTHKLNFSVVSGKVFHGADFFYFPRVEIVTFFVFLLPLV